MPKKSQSIPVNQFGDQSGVGISIERIAFEDLPDSSEWEQPERHDRHSFFLVEEGSVNIEIDFVHFHIRSPAVIYLHPDQVHRIIGLNGVTVYAMAITNEVLQPDYLHLLENISSAEPIQLEPETFALLYEAASLCIKLAKREKDRFYRSLLKDHCNGLVGLILANYTTKLRHADNASRADLVTKVFREDLSKHFIQLKRPADYAARLNLSVSYLNECVKAATGHSVSIHIQERVILEAKRLLYHSDQSLKEISSALGYDDYTYFSRLFTKVAGVAPFTFRKKNRG